jgi:hypothetical protein
MLGVALGRIADTGDDELAFAWHASGGETRYRRRQASASFRNASLHRYRPAHVERAARLVAQASGLAPAGWLAGMGAQLGWRILRLQLRRAREAGARARGG